MRTAGLPTIWELVAEGAAALPQPFSRAALINWVSARRPDVGVASIAAHIQFATENAAHPEHGPFAGRTPLLYRVGRGRYRRFRAPDPAWWPVAGPVGTGDGGRVLLLASAGELAEAPTEAAGLFLSAGFARARKLAAASDIPWFVLSAKHGLLDPDDVVGPYDLQLADQSSTYRSAWGEWVVAQLGERVALEGTVVEVHGGVDFAQPRRHPLGRRGAGLEMALPESWSVGDREPEHRAGGRSRLWTRPGRRSGSARG
jgi:hypothetical protein